MCVVSRIPEILQEGDPSCLLLRRALGVRGLVVLQRFGTAIIEEVDRYSVVTTTIAGGELPGKVRQEVDVSSVVFAGC